MAVLREVKYLTVQDQEAIPPCASDVFAKHETFQKYVGNLDLIASWYNKVKRQILVYLLIFILSLHHLDCYFLDSSHNTACGVSIN